MMEEEQQGGFSPGRMVRLKSDPGRMGTLTGRRRERAGSMRYQVNFADGRSFQPEHELELVADDDDWESLLDRGQFGRVGDLRRNMTHIHLSGRLANLVYSMDAAANTDFYAYQYKPVLSFLESPSNGLLIADEVGLGKTIEAGLIWTELRARYNARRLMVVCPAMLREKWASELSNRFGVDADIVNAEEVLKNLRQDRHATPDGKGMICSVQGIRPPRGWQKEDESKSARAQLARFLDEKSAEEPLVDLVIIDEAHYMRNPASQNAKLGQLLREVAEHVVLLSATPINTRDTDLFHLLNLVDPDSFNVEEVFPDVVAANEYLQVAREHALNPAIGSSAIQDALIKAAEHPLLRSSQQLQDLIEQPDLHNYLDTKRGRIHLANRIEKINLLRHVITRTRKAEVTEWRVVRDPVRHFVELGADSIEWKFYTLVTDVIRDYAWEAGIVDGFLLAGPQRQVSSCMYAAAKAWQDRFEDFEEQLYEDFGYDGAVESKISPLLERIRRDVMPHVDLAALRAVDSKYKKFRETVQGYLKDNPGEKLVVFSYFRGTLKYLHERLREDGITSQILVGGMRESKQELIGKFRDSPDISVLLSSEVASEGVDLQFCRVLVNYDLPWNPMKVEQRIGRIDRIGQSASTIKIVNLLIAGTIDHRIYERLYERLQVFTRALGGMEAILGEEISDLTADLLKDRLTPEQENERIERTAMAVERIREQQKELEENASQLIAHGGYILDEVQAAHNFKKRITEADLVSYVEDYLNRFSRGFEFTQTSTDAPQFNIKLPGDLAAGFDDFIKKNKLHGQTRLATGDSVRCRFSSKVASRGAREEVISQFHPLIRFIGTELQLHDEAFYELIAAKVSTGGQVTPGRYAFFVSRWEFEGLKVEEELPVRMVDVKTRKVLSRDDSWDLLNRVRVDGNDWLGVENEVDLSEVREAVENCEEVLDRDFEAEKSRRETENTDLISFQIDSLTKKAERQIASKKQQLEVYRESNRQRMIPALEGLLKKSEERFEDQKVKLKAKSRMKAHQRQVCCGVVRVD